MYAGYADQGAQEVLPASTTTAANANADKESHPSAPTTPAALAIPCPEPAHLFSAKDYDGPMRGAINRFGGKRDVTRGLDGRPCALDASEKFGLFTHSIVNPLTYLSAGYNAGIAQAQDNDPTFGQGGQGYGKRYAAALTDQLSRNFFRKFAYPVIFRQDPRYFPGEGTGGSRLRHALSHVFVARSDDGGNMFNYSEWFGTTSTVALGNLYHPGHDRGFTPAAQRFGISIGEDMGMDVLREFWPEIVRKFRLPFRERQTPPLSTSRTQSLQSGS
jgi:hypothetical protein